MSSSTAFWIKVPGVEGVSKTPPRPLLCIGPHTRSSHVVDIDDRVQIVAVARNIEKPVREEVANSGVQMLFAKGEKLVDLLLQNQLLEDMPSDDGHDPKATVRRCTRIGKVNEYLNDFCFVCISTTALFPFPVWLEPTGTCYVSCRYGNCEHAVFVEMLDLKVRKATVQPESLPKQRARGRPRGSQTQKSAAAKSKAIGTAKGKARVQKTCLTSQKS